MQKVPYDTSLAGAAAALKAGRLEMRALQERVNVLILIVCRYPLFPALKTILGWTGIDCGPCLTPRREALTATEAERLRADLTGAGLYGPLFARAEVG